MKRRRMIEGKAEERRALHRMGPFLLRIDVAMDLQL